MKVREIIKLIQDDGWFLKRTRGSHRQFHHSAKRGTVTVAGAANDDLPKKNSAQYSQASKATLIFYAGLSHCA